MAGKKAVLLLESNDIALMSVHKLVDAFQVAFPTLPTALDELWFVHHVDPPRLNIYDLRRGQMWVFDPTTDRIVHHNDDTPRLAT
jgi:hypothetical protein